MSPPSPDCCCSPESDQKCRTASGDSYACGARATAFLAQLAGRAGVSCRPSGRDVNGRTRAVCHAGETELNRALVGAGWALADTRYFVRYGFDQLRARWHAAGLWQGPFVAPWEWRDPQPEFTIDWQLILVVVIVPSFGLVGWARRW
ncbi:MAG: thermonuclease family protein [Rhodospirillales bacterium]|nr:thermonuclease family protein [Rhodospirillales bacterium]